MNPEKRDNCSADSIAARFAQSYRSRRSQVLFILGHMRSGSSLLVHVLNSHSQIIGYGETHITYEDEDDFCRLAEAVYSSFDDDELSESYLLDKVLHDYIADPTLLELPAVKVLFLVRDPVQTLLSLSEMDFISSAAEALDYYVEQLKVLERYARARQESAFLLTYDQLTRDTEVVLKFLQEYLGLRTPLAREYENMWSTGLRGVGDSSKKIVSGCIQSPRSRQRREMPQQVTDRAEAAFRKCVMSLKRCSSFLDPI